MTYKRFPDGSLKLESATHGSGRIVVHDDPENPDDPTKRIYENQYYITDHLGSVRVVFNQQGEVLARNDYYPFGKQHNNPALTAATTSGTSGTSETPGTSTKPADNRYLYNGKEKQLTGNLNFLDYGARMYDSEIVRWHNPDPMTEMRNRLTPYNFVQNNPIRRVDPTGMLDDLFITGDAANKALEELQKSTTMKLSMGENGKVSATQQGTMMKGSDFELLNVINDSSVIVKVDATEIPYANGVFTVGGSAMETKIITNGSGYRITEANQRVVPSVLSKMSEANGKPGADMKHEVDVYERMYDARGNVTTNRNEAHKVEYYVIPQGKAPLIIMTYP